MFESALITRAGGNQEIDVGTMAETIFFYKSTQLLLNRGSITALAKCLDPSDLISMFDRTGVKLSYLQPNFGVVKSGMPPTHQFIAFTFGGDQKKKVQNYKEEIAMMLERALGQSRSTRKLVNSINDRVAKHRFHEPDKEAAITALAIRDASDASFIRDAAILVLNELVPEFVIPPDFRFALLDTGKGFAIDTNIDFTKVNSLYHLRVSPEHSSLSGEYILSHLITARSESYFAADYMSEIVTTPIYSNLIGLKHFDFLRRRETSAQEVQLFHDTLLPDFPRISEAINSKQRSISDFLRLLDQAQKFKEWLNHANPDEGLIRSYYKSATEKTWADKLPTKSIRFSIATSLGFAAETFAPTGIGASLGLILGAADSLYIDRLIKGWRPNQFVDGPLKRFVSETTTS